MELTLLLNIIHFFTNNLHFNVALLLDRYITNCHRYEYHYLLKYGLTYFHGFVEQHIIFNYHRL